MKAFKVLIYFLIVIFANSYSFAQKIGVVDTNYILSKLPQYTEAQSRLDAQIKTWEQQLQKMQSEFETKKAAFENEKVLLVGDQLKLKETEIKNLEKNIQKFIAEKFSGDGEINKFRASLAKPFQDLIWNTIKTIVDKNNLGIVLDKSNNISVIFLDKKYDYTDKVLELLIKSPSKDDKNKDNKNETKTKNKK